MVLGTDEFIVKLDQSERLKEARRQGGGQEGRQRVRGETEKRDIGKKEGREVTEE